MKTEVGRNMPRQLSTLRNVAVLFVWDVEAKKWAVWAGHWLLWMSWGYAMKVSRLLSLGQSAVQVLSSIGDAVAGTVGRNLGRKLGRIYATTGIWACTWACNMLQHELGQLDVAFVVVAIVAPPNCRGNLPPKFCENQLKEHLS
ncbi:hypothetical protein V6N13_074228 [Hibiscus sabdariffa]